MARPQYSRAGLLEETLDHAGRLTRTAVLTAYPPGEVYQVPEAVGGIGDDSFSSGFDLVSVPVQSWMENGASATRSGSVLQVTTLAGNSLSKGGWGTQEKVDISPVGRFMVDWADSGGVSGASHAGVGSHRDLQPGVGRQRRTVYGGSLPFSRKTDFVNVADLSGDWYIGAYGHSASTETGSQSRLSVYSMKAVLASSSLVDGDSSTYWQAHSEGDWFFIDLDVNAAVRNLQLYWPDDEDYRPGRISFWSASDGSDPRHLPDYEFLSVVGERPDAGGWVEYPVAGGVVAWGRYLLVLFEELGSAGAARCHGVQYLTPELWAHGHVNRGR